MSRIKIIILILLIAVLSIVFIQNRDTEVALKFLCGDVNSTFCPQSIPLPLTVWIVLFTLLGAIASGLIRFLDRYRHNGSERKSVNFDDELYSSNWRSDRLNKDSGSSQARLKKPKQDRAFQNNSYETEQEPQSVERSGSTYSYKYREAGAEKSKQQDIQDETQPSSQTNSERTQDDDEDWI
ncbi:MAG: hypothetical protein AAFQ80_18075 [Cyanobacteria bacterium J06621_8]